MNNQTHEDDTIEIDLGAVLFALRRWIAVIALTGFLGALGAFAVTKLFMTPKYTAESRMLILANDSQITSLGDLQMGSQLANDYKVMAISRPVLDSVIEKLKLEMTVKQLSGILTLDNPSNTRILVIRAEHEDPQMALDIAVRVTKEASKYIGDMMGVTPPKIIDEGVLPVNPSSPSTMKNVAIGLFLGLLLSCGVVTLRVILDDTIKTEEDVEKYLGLSTLSVVPDRKDFINQSKDKNSFWKMFNRNKKIGRRA